MYQVLLVDDEPILQLGIRRMLEGAADYQICASARNGEEALQYLQAHPVDIVMTDLKMPVMDGITLIKELKRRQLPAPVIVLSNYSDFELVREALTEGASDYVLKLDLTAQTLLKHLDKLAANLNAVRRTRGEQLPPQEQGELRALVMSLPENERLPIVLHYLEGFSTQEIASALRCPKGTILSRMSRGRRHLKRFLTEE